MLTADRELGQHRLRRHGRLAWTTARRRSSRPPRTSASRATRRSSWGIPRTLDRLRRTNVGVTLGTAPGQPDQHGQRLRHPRQRRRRATTSTSWRRSSTRTARPSTRPSRRSKRDRRRGHRRRRDLRAAAGRRSPGSGTEALALDRPAAGKTGTATNDDDEVSSSWFVGFTPQISTAVMYVRGKGREGSTSRDPTAPTLAADQLRRQVRLLRRQLPRQDLDLDHATGDGGHGGRGLPGAGLRRRRRARRRPRVHPAARPRRSRAKPTKTPHRRRRRPRRRPRRPRRRRPRRRRETPDGDADADARADRRPTPTDPGADRLPTRRRRRPTPPDHPGRARSSRASRGRPPPLSTPVDRPPHPRVPGDHEAPTRTDPVAAAMSEVVGGPLGDHAGRHRWWSAVARAAGATALMLAAGMVSKTRLRAVGLGQGAPALRRAVLDRPRRHVGRRRHSAARGHLAASELAELLPGTGTVATTAGPRRAPRRPRPAGHRPARPRRRAPTLGRRRLGDRSRAARPLAVVGAGRGRRRGGAAVGLGHRPRAGWPVSAPGSGPRSRCRSRCAFVGVLAVGGRLRDRVDALLAAAAAYVVITLPGRAQRGGRPTSARSGCCSGRHGSRRVRRRPAPSCSSWSWPWRPAPCGGWSAGPVARPR